MRNHFTHLHLHSEYSLLDGAITIEKLITFAKNNNFLSAAITDHGNIFGAVKFFQQAKKAGIRPILGMEAYITEDAAIKNPHNKYYHLIIIVENEQGYRNLCKLIAFSYQDGFYFKPRIDYNILKKYSEGLIVTTACLGGHIPSLLVQKNYDEAERRLDWFCSVFGKDRFFLEIQPGETDEQILLNNELFLIHEKFGISLLATADCHYVNIEDRGAHEVMLAIQTQHKITDSKRFTFGNVRAYMRTANEMLALFPQYPEAIWQSGKIADRCLFDFSLNQLFFPKFLIPEHETEETYFSSLCYQGFQQLVNDHRINHDLYDLYYERLSLEIKLIQKMKFIGYFLVVSDFIQWAKKNGIPVGPGRGSVAGSLVAWALQITDIDPIKYNLLFERFLNPERISMPDIDIDFCIEGRDRVISYVKDKYGHDHVSQIITFGTMLAKGVIKDVARALGFPFEDSNSLTALIPDQLKISLKEACEQEPKINEMIKGNPKIAELFDIGFRLEGITRHASKHAAGIVITPQPVVDMLPVYVPSKTNELVTQYGMTELESLGFLKMDFLGLKNLTLIQRTVESIKKNYSLVLDMYQLSLHDEKTFALLCKGNTTGVFQLESNGLKDVLRRLRPEKFEDIIAVNALYRPGPLGSGMVDDFIERRHGRQQISYLFPELALILAETYGIIVYQEQVMKISSVIAGFSLGESDILRRAMGKKKSDVMEEQKSIFIERAVARNFDKKKSEELFELMAYFSGYGFNKSHSAAYALIAYQTAYLKANFPADFMSCLISLESSDAEKMAFYLDEARDMGLIIHPPNINESLSNFTASNQSHIQFGLQGIKNVGQAAINEIIEKRSQKKFVDMLDFCVHVDLRIVNKRVLEHLIFAGAFDLFYGHRAQKYHSIPELLDISAKIKLEKETKQLGLFGGNLSSLDVPFQMKAVDEWDMIVKLEKEYEVTGVYISGKPLDQYKTYFSLIELVTLREAQKLRTWVMTYGIMKNIKVVTTKSGASMAFAVIEDYNYKAEVIIFPKVYEKMKSWDSQYHAFIVKGSSEDSTDQLCKIVVSSLIPIELLVRDGYGITKMIIHLPEALDMQLLEQIKLKTVAGTLPLIITFFENNQYLKIITKMKISFSHEYVHELLKQGFMLKLGID